MRNGGEIKFHQSFQWIALQPQLADANVSLKCSRKQCFNLNMDSFFIFKDILMTHFIIRQVQLYHEREGAEGCLVHGVEAAVVEVDLLQVDHVDAEEALLPQRHQGVVAEVEDLDLVWLGKAGEP